MKAFATRVNFWLMLLAVLCPSLLTAQNPPSRSLNRPQETKLAELMCRQLPNVSILPFKGALIGDDVNDTLVRLGERSVPCLIARITDETWMPDPQQAPKWGDVRAGDTAFLILNGMGVDFSVVIPMLDKKRWKEVGMYAYFEWVREGDHRKRLQEVLLHWVREHPNRCVSQEKVDATPRVEPKFRLSARRLSVLRQRLARIELGMGEKSVLQLLGPSDLVQQSIVESELRLPPAQIRLGADGRLHQTLGPPEMAWKNESPWPNPGMGDRAEKSAAIYYVERWSDSRANRDSLRDRYVILFFSEQGRLVRIFSNVDQIPPRFPGKRITWLRLMGADEVP